MDKRGVVATAIAGALMAVTGCGGDSKTVTVTKQAGTDTASTPTSSAPSPETPVDCRELVRREKAGRCVAKGVDFTVAPPNSTLKMKSMSVQVADIRTADSVSNSGIGAIANGTFVIITLSVTNRLDSPQQFGSFGDSAQLLYKGKQYSESFDAENQADAQSFESQLEDIQPGASQTGDVVFDIPSDVAGGAAKHGGLLLAELGEDLKTGNSAGLILLGTPIG